MLLPRFGAKLSEGAFRGVDHLKGGTPRGLFGDGVHGGTSRGDPRVHLDQSSDRPRAYRRGRRAFRADGEPHRFSGAADPRAAAQREDDRASRLLPKARRFQKGRGDRRARRDRRRLPRDPAKRDRRERGRFNGIFEKRGDRARDPPFIPRIPDLRRDRRGLRFRSLLREPRRKADPHRALRKRGGRGEKRGGARAYRFGRGELYRPARRAGGARNDREFMEGGRWNGRSFPYWRSYCP